ncbi:hypothetical protein GCM10009739_17130 [Microbacterium ulmi]
MSIPPPAIAHAISVPATPVLAANWAGSEKTPAPTIDPTTMPESVSRDTVAARRGVVGVPVEATCRPDSSLDVTRRI